MDFVTELFDFEGSYLQDSTRFGKVVRSPKQ